MLAPKLMTKFLLLATVSATAVSHIYQAYAQKQLTIAAPGYEKTITLDEDPELVISYTPNGMKINFANLNMKVVCIEDPSTDGVCRLQAYDGSIGGIGGGVPASPAKPSAVASDGAVTLTWTAPADNGSPIVGYKIDQTSPTNTTITSNTNRTETSYVIGSLTNGTAYTFAVAAINGSGLGYMSPSSDAVTPAASGGGGGGGGTDISGACSTVPANTECKVLAGGELASNNYVDLTIDSGTTVTFPFSLESSSEASGGFRVNSFYNTNGSIAGSFFEMWVSTSPAGSTDLNGIVPGTNTSSCYRSRQWAEFTIDWVRAATKPNSDCYLGTLTDTGLIWVNMRFRNFETGALNYYGTTSFFAQ